MPPRQLFQTISSDDGVPGKRRLIAALLAMPGLMPALAHAQLSGAAAQPDPLGDAWSLRLAPQLEDHPRIGTQRPATFVLGDSATGTANTDIAVKGSGEVRQSTAVVKADALHYDLDTDVANGFGNVIVSQNGTVFRGPDARLRVEANEGYMTAPKYHFTLTGGSGSAQRADLLDDERSVLTHGTYTACQCTTDPAWYIKGSEFDFDTGASEGVAHNSVLFFQGVPIFASPWLSFPLTGDRRSGVLPPTFSISSTNGYELAVPYYFNIAPNRDATITPELISKRGLFTTANFRYLSPNYAGTFTGTFLPDDAITKTNRYAIFFQHNQNFGNGFGGYISYNRVSDNTYPQDLGQTTDTILQGMQLLYQQEAGLTYNNGPWSVLARAQHWQTLTPSAAPYNREPELNVKYAKYNVGGFDYGAQADFTRFTITTPNSTEGNRFVFDPYLSYSLMGPGYFVTPKIQWHFASYDLSNIGPGFSPVPVGQPKTFNVSVPTLSFDTGLVFERSVRLFGQDFTQTLEPRLYYVYTPYVNQEFAPIFDTAESDFGLAEIFTPNTFVGEDRIADANRITAAVTTRFLNPATGDERARFVLAQQYYFRDQQVTLLPGETPAQATHSDLIAGMSLKLGANFASETAFQYNADNNQLEKASVGFGYSPGRSQVLNVSYRYTRSNLTTLENQPINQFLISSQWPLSHHIYAVGRVNYDMKNHRIVDGLLGMQYDADCWMLGAGIQRYADGINSAGAYTTATRFMMQLTLKGLSNVDNGLVAAFRTGVAGYTPPPGPPPLPSRFTDYE